MKRSFAVVIALLAVVSACRRGPLRVPDATYRETVSAFYTGLAALAKEMARQAEEIAVHFTHPGRARDDAIALVWQVAPAAFAGPDTAVLDPEAATDRMLAAIKAAHARDLTALAEQLFRAVAHRALTTMLADPAFVEPHRWRDALCRHGIPIVTIR